MTIQIDLNQAHLGVDWDGPIPVGDANIVLVEPPGSPLSGPDFQQLLTTINPLDSSNNYGMDLYIETVDFILARL